MAVTKETLAEFFSAVRDASHELIQGLSVEDMLLQSMNDASPIKWHLAHTSWFFEELILAPFMSGYERMNEGFRYYFNSYYEALGERHPRARRGMLSRPSLEEALAYRKHVDRHILALLSKPDPDPQLLQRVELGLHHEMQHQELMITDMLHALSFNPAYPAWKPPLASTTESSSAAQLEWFDSDGGLFEIGAHSKGFSYDCEGPRHKVFQEPFRLASRTVTNGEWLAFMDAGGYADPKLWLSDGWAARLQEDWRAPLYWIQRDGGWLRFTPHGLTPLNPDEPVCHVNYFEADAYARWAQARLPSEAEWEIAARSFLAGIAKEGESGGVLPGHFMEQGRWTPSVSRSQQGQALADMFGNVWEWTQSAYSSYPGFKPLDGALGEYNGKFMCGQFVLRGGAFTSPRRLLRASYRNFFYPHQRWQATGVRLARDD
ncbi:ergothioneine biosynthesis protein EgtB [Hahella aquimaris]|uniref:ergothioneine biosynthesis protein EgtB n=1 Tax=Hahella sp. HNIBRBA332 TaxID=3015983 RepID=UPI00273CEC05|nr:ergothioneine biosynthesis protein EgtB [Hahella sp. HNIBRBA332]WLQ13723.1 ergothioneine biosynthesis protein EgtB [Hahella sp. HNIBRBA332]